MLVLQRREASARGYIGTGELLYEGVNGSSTVDDTEKIKLLLSRLYCSGLLCKVSCTLWDLIEVKFAAEEFQQRSPSPPGLLRLIFVPYPSIFYILEFT